MKVELYTLTYCPHCRAAVELLTERGLDFTNHVMDSETDELNSVKAKYGHGTVPLILIDGELIGGNDNLRALDAAGKLAV